MKKTFLFVLLCLMALSINAQRCAVLEFKAGVGISQADVDGISAIFITYFRPAGYTMVERTQINKAIDEQRYQRGNMTESQMVRIGQILNVSKIVVGDINVVMGQYNVDARVINVETGTIAAAEGATFSGSSYRESMKSVAEKLASKIAITSGGAVQSQSSGNSRKRNSVEVIYGYLKIFPNEIGEFNAEPSSVIAQINKQNQHGYNNWRIPTNEELSLMRANGYLSNGEYMTRENRKGKVLLVSDGDDYATVQERERIAAEEAKRKAEEEEARRKAELKAYVNLGLPSGTLWKDKNEDGGFYTYDQAMAKFGKSLPNKEQLEELKRSCRWTWRGNGYDVEGPNGNKVFFPAAGYRNCGGAVSNVGSYGHYWSSTPYDSFYAWYLDFFSSKVGVGYYDRCCGRSVRLVR